MRRVIVAARCERQPRDRRRPRRDEDPRRASSTATARSSASRETPTPVDSQDDARRGDRRGRRRAARRPRGRVGFGVPSQIDQRDRHASVASVNIPLGDVPLRDMMAERLGLPVGDRQRRQRRRDRRVEAAAPAAGRSTMVMLTLGTGVGGGLVLDGRPYRGVGRARAHRDRVRRPAVPGHLHRPRAPRGVRERATPPTRVAQRGFGPGRDRARLVRLADEGDDQALEMLAGSASSSAPAIGSLVNIFDPELVVIGGGFGVARVELLLEPAREMMRARGARRRGRDSCGSCAPSSATTAGVVGAGLRRVRGARRRDAVPLAVCATPIGNLEDVTLRVLRELREADVVLCEDTRATRGLLERHGIGAHAAQLPRAQRGEADGRAAAAARGGRADRARVRRGPAGRLRPRRAADRRRARRRRAR